jgi:hypothetical protein
MARLMLDRELERLPDQRDWQELRALLLDHYPDAVALDVATPQQYDAEQALLATELPAADRYFGISRR